MMQATPPRACRQVDQAGAGWASGEAGAWRWLRQPDRSPCTAAAPMIGPAGGGSVTGYEDEGSRLDAAEAAVERDELLERAASSSCGS